MTAMQVLFAKKHLHAAFMVKSFIAITYSAGIDHNFQVLSLNAQQMLPMIEPQLPIQRQQNSLRSPFPTPGENCSK
jgi:hypothetical protein